MHLASILPLLLASTATALPSSPKSIMSCSPKPPAFILAGDSTTAIQLITPESKGGGWGPGFISYLRSPAIGENYGHNGATTASYVTMGDWATVLGRVNAVKKEYNPIVTIQFGHNDQKPAANLTIAQYQANLESLARQVISAGGTPILVTSLTRRVFDANTHKVLDSLHNERLATIAAAKAVGIRYLDLNLASSNYINALGNETAGVYDLEPTDRTHLNARGAKVFGRMVADLLLGWPADGKVDGVKEVIGGVLGGACWAKWVKLDLEVSAKIWSGREA